MGSVRTTNLIILQAHAESPPGMPEAATRHSGTNAELARLRARVAELEHTLAQSRRTVLPVDMTPACGGCEAQRQLIHLVDSLPVLAAYIGADARLSFVNELFEHWYQAPRAELVQVAVAANAVEKKPDSV